MAGDSLSVLCTGDVHLGRHPTRIPSELDGTQFSPGTVWQATVETAIRRGVDLVALTGDVVDRENRYFEAYGDLERGIERLDVAGIPTVAVAGNHDYDVFPRLAAELGIDSLHLLGADGEWERETIALDGGRAVHVDGWSFPQSHVAESPLASYDLPAADGPTIGLLHADVDARGSDYAPVELGSLLETRVDCWLLGHVHRPRVHNRSDPLVVYPGSPQPLDPGERGAHGPWELTVDERGGVEYEHRPLATLRYDRLAVDVSGAADPKAVPPLVRAELEAEFGDGAIPTGPLELLLARVRLAGRTDAHAALHRRRADVEADLGLSLDGTTVRIEELRLDTRPAVDLADLATGDGPVASLAALLLALDGETEAEHEGGVELEGGTEAEYEGGTEAEYEGGAETEYEGGVEFEGVVTDALAAMREAHRANAYRELRREGAVDEPTRADAVAALEDRARLLLDELLAQREEPA